MQGELFPLPNLNSKIIRSNIASAPGYLLMPFFKDKDTQTSMPLINYLEITGIKNLTPEETDVLIAIFHLYLTQRKEDNLLYFNTDDILILRGIKKNKTTKTGMSGYKKNVRLRIDAEIKKLSKLNIFAIADYRDFNFVLCLKDSWDEIPKAYPLKQEILSFNPHTKSWHKAIGIFLTVLRAQSNSRPVYVQVKKLLNQVNCSSMFPFQIRNRLEDVLDSLIKIRAIGAWQYKNIDENELNSKNWLFFWKLLSVKIIF